MLFIALPVPVIVSNFAYYYSKERNRQMTREMSPEEGTSTSADNIRSLICCPTVNEQNTCTGRKVKNGKIIRGKRVGSSTEEGGPSELMLEMENNGNPRMGPVNVIESNV